jgi:hypothetical protein
LLVVVLGIVKLRGIEDFGGDRALTRRFKRLLIEIAAMKGRLFLRR